MNRYFEVYGLMNVQSYTQISEPSTSARFFSRKLTVFHQVLCLRFSQFFRMVSLGVRLIGIPSG